MIQLSYLPIQHPMWTSKYMKLTLPFYLPSNSATCWVFLIVLLSYREKPIPLARFVLLTFAAKDQAPIEMEDNMAYEVHKLPHSHPQPVELQPCAAYGVVS